MMSTITEIPYIRLVALAIILTASIASQVSAALIPEFTGWTEMNDCPPCDGTVSFGVFENTGGDWRNDSFFSSVSNPNSLAGSVTGSEKYVYLYQVVNTDNNQPPGFPFEEAPIGEFQVLNQSNSESLFSAGGYFNAVFQDAVGPVQGTNDNFTLAEDDFGSNNYGKLGAAEVGDDSAPDKYPSPERNGGNNNNGQGADLPSDGLPSHSGIHDVNLSDTIGSAVAPSALDLLFVPAPNILNTPYDYVVNFFWESGIPLNASSLLLFLTSDSRPVYDFGSTRSFAGTMNECGFPPGLDSRGCFFPGAAGDVPTAAAPEPATLVLLGLGFAGMRYQRRKKLGS